MGRNRFSETDYAQARRDLGITRDRNVTYHAEEEARITGKLNQIVDPAVDPIRRSLIRLNPYRKKYVVTVGCPIDITVDCDTTGSMGGEVDTEMRILPKLANAVTEVLPGYDPQLCLGIFGDCEDRFVLCRPQFEMEAGKIVAYLKEMAPQRGGAGNDGEDPQYALFARAYLTDSYANRIGLKGYHFTVTDEPCHNHLHKTELKRIFGANIFHNELSDLQGKIPTVVDTVQRLKEQTHQFILLLENYRYHALSRWQDLCGENSVLVIPSTEFLPDIISAIIGLTEGTVSVGDIEARLRKAGCYSPNLEARLAAIDIGAQAKLRHALPYPVPKKGDIFLKKGDLWPIQEMQPVEDGEDQPQPQSGIRYL